MQSNQFEHHDAIVKLHAKTRQNLDEYIRVVNNPSEIYDSKAFFMGYEGTATLFQLLDRYIKRGNVMDYRFICQNCAEELEGVKDASE